MKRGLDWYQRDPRAFLDGVQGMGPELIGAYAVLLDLIYARGGETRRDDHHLAGVMGCSKRKAASLTDELIKRRKISIEGAFITNSVAKSTASARRSLSEERAEAGRKGGLKSGEVRNNNRLAEANASKQNEPEKSREEKKEGGGGDAGARDPDPPPENRPEVTTRTEREIVLEAMGADPISGLIGPNGVQLGRAADILELRRWRTDLNLSLDEITTVIADVMARKHDGPPRSFTYFSEPMARLAGAKTRPNLTPIEGGAHERHHPGQPRPNRGSDQAFGSRAHENMLRGFARAVSEIGD